jgi:NAD(P)H-hydrate epimerase
MKIFTIDQIKELDRYTILHEPIESIDLMKRASQCFVDFFQSEITTDRPIYIFAGYGNNGGDALVVAKLLIHLGYHVTTYLFNTENKLSPNCETNKNALLLLPHANFIEITNNFSPPLLQKNDVVIDGLFGSGLNRPLTGGFAAVVKFINQSKATVYSIEIPSGMFGDDNSANNPETIIRADITPTFQTPKLSFFLSDNSDYTGEWKILDIGIHPEALRETPSHYYYTEKKDISGILKSRSKFAHKGQFGHVLLIAGSKGKMGAAVLSAKSCMKSGTGLLTCHIPECGYSILQSAFPEAMINTDPEENYISELPAHVDRFDAVGIGPGIGQHSRTTTTLETLFTSYKKPVVIDADALNLISKNEHLRKLIPPKSILTPHPKEFDRIAGESVSSYERLLKARDLAETLDCYIALKGAYSTIITPEKECWFNPTGNPGMATAGSGDVLTGILTGLLGQGYTPFESCLLGVYLHGLAGDLCLETESQESLIAEDIIGHIGPAFKKLISFFQEFTLVL